MIRYPGGKKLDAEGLLREILASRKLIFKVCCIGAIVGIVIGFGIPKEYTANTLIAPESISRSSSSGLSALVGGGDIEMEASSGSGRDAIYPSLYPAIVNSTPFLIRLFDVKVHEVKDTTELTLARYLRERQKRPWWSVITSLPTRLVAGTVSLFRGNKETEKTETVSEMKRTSAPLCLTREEAGIAGAIASRINIGVDKKKRTITVFVSMQDPMVAAIVADTVRTRLKEYITEYRTNKARKVLEYNEKLCKNAQTEYYESQKKYTRYADANRNLTLLTSRAELSRLRSEMELASSSYNQLKLQVRAARAKVEKVTPVYAVIQPVVVPLKPSKPRKVVIFLVCVILSGAASVGWVLLVYNRDMKIMKQDYLIAGHRIRIEGDRLVQTVESMPGFAVFKTELASEPLCRFMTSESKVPDIERELYRNENEGVVSRFGCYADGYAFVMTLPGGESLNLWMEKDKHTACFAGNFDPGLLRFACWIAFGVATLPFQTVAIHTSAIQYRGKAICFLGESGTGKSTHTRLWRENIEDAVLLNDDSPILRIIDGKPWVYGSPWSGKTPCYKNESYPLVACVRLSKALYNKAERLSVAQGYGALHPSCPPCFAYDDRLYDSIGDILGNVLSAVPVYHLFCLPNADAARLSCKTIFGVCEK